MKITILGIDPGLLNTGWGIISNQSNSMSYIACGTLKVPSNLIMSRRLQIIYSKLLNIIDSYSITDCCIEDVFVNKNPDTSMRLGQARGVAMLACSIRDFDVVEYQNRQVKKAIVGTGRADKQQVEYMVKSLLPRAKIDSEHSTDALAIAITHATISKSIFIKEFK